MNGSTLAPTYTLHLANIVTPGAVVNAGGWNGIFGNERPLNLEIGIGGGEFLLGLAAKNPEENYIGLDLAGKFLKKAARRALRANLTNVRFLIHDAKATLYEAFEHESIQSVYINFPDPWPKKGHEKRRHFDPFFLALLEDRLATGGILYLATDVQEYAEQAHETLGQSELLENAYREPWLNDRGWNDLLTRYERKWKEQGKTLFYLAFCKARGLRTPRYDLSREPFAPFPIPHLSLEVADQRLRGLTAAEGKYILKTLSCRPRDGALHARLLLIDRDLGFKDYLHAVIRAGSSGVVFDLENAGDIVFTETKRRALTRILDHLGEER